MLAASDGTPTLVAADSLQIGPVGMLLRDPERLVVYPNPTTDGWVMIDVPDGGRLELKGVQTIAGERVAVRTEPRRQGLRVQLPTTSGTYVLLFHIDGRPVIKRVVRR
jgi:hypothetical protein